GIAVSFCSQEEKPLLDEIQKLLPKAIDVIPISKSAYKIIATPPPEVGLAASLRQMLDSEDNYDKRSKKKKKKEIEKKSSANT
ncbi:MAG: hypothetical protein JNM39_14415, partial [Bdellovibrionaceae bacterium]|nr:hypothetical protein [Pseudobdellovibrionaceae bacterium]